MRALRRTPAQLDPVAYDRLVGDAFFVSRGFLELWRERGGRPVVWTLEADGALAGVLPGVEFGRAPLSRFASMPDGCYGGLSLAPGLERERRGIATALLDAIARHRYGRTHVFDFHATLVRHPAHRLEKQVTTLVKLPGPEAWPPDPRLRSQIRKAAREGIVVERYDAARHREKFLALDAATCRRQGRPPRYGPRFYDALAELAARDRRVVWQWCEHDGRPVCSHIYFVECGMLQAWQTCFDKAYSFLKPNQYIRWLTSVEQMARGVEWLNLGGTPAGARGLAYYKARWGGSRVEIASYAHSRGLGALADRWRSGELLPRRAGQGGPAGVLLPAALRVRTPSRLPG